MKKLYLRLEKWKLSRKIGGLLDRANDHEANGLGYDHPAYKLIVRAIDQEIVSFHEKHGVSFAEPAAVTSLKERIAEESRSPVPMLLKGFFGISALAACLGWGYQVFQFVAHYGAR